WGGYTPTYPYEVAWSPDGTQLALLVRRCTWQEGVIKDCGSSIERFSIPITVEEPAVFPYPQPLPRAILTYEYGRPCGLTWSPDGAFIAFRSSCGFVMSGVFNEVFMLDVAQSTIQQVTYLTNPAPLIDTIPLNYMNSYDFAWSADNQLLAGIVRALGIAVIDPVTFSAGSFAYPHPFVTPMSISTSVAREWARNPVDGMLAYRAEATQLNAENGLYDANRQTKIATYQTGTLTEIAAGTPGCDYRWSPDGAYLMYRTVAATTTPGIACSMSNTFVLYQSASSSFSTYAVDDYVWPAGWVVLPGSPQS
ncbi:MAG: hypothetical protein KC547_08705, partial [Anaerolineae bacterium]|nr:hypothetical protein [Anaerolineae bacterium]